MVSDAQGVKAEIATRVNEKMSEVSNQYHRLVGTSMLEGSTPLLFSPELPSHCTSPLDLSPRWGPVDSPLLSSCGLTQQLNISAVSWNTSPACESFFSVCWWFGHVAFGRSQRARQRIGTLKSHAESCSVIGRM